MARLYSEWQKYVYTRSGLIRTSTRSMTRAIIEETRIEIVFLRGQGKNISEIALELELSRPTVHKWLSHHARI